MDIKPFEEIYPFIEHYTPFVHGVFRYLNGNINPDNPCTLHIRLYSDVNYAEYAKPDIVVVYLGSIINNYWMDDDSIKRVIIMTIAHELSHSWQSTDMIRYTYDPYYKQQIENQNEGRTEQWLLAHADEIYKLFGIQMEYSDWAMREVYPHGDEYESANVGHYYIHTILDVVYRNEKFKEPLEKLFNGYDSIIFHIDDSEKCLLKFKGEYNIRAIYAFNRIISKYCRIGISISYFTIELEIIDIPIFDTMGIDVHMHIRNQYYNPIEFKFPQQSDIES